MAPSQSGAPSSSRRWSRPKLRQATFILPRSGQRLRGLVSLRDRTRTSAASGDNNGDGDGDGDGENGNDERRALLTGEIVTQRKRFSPWLSGRTRELWMQAHQFIASEPSIGVLKCSLAYFLGSLATFIPPISEFLGHHDGKHMVATATVYFHPARTQGSMFRASICALLALCYSTFLSITSMLVENFFQDTLCLPAVGHAVVLVVFCGGGLGFVGWIKQRFGDPLVNIACSLTALSTITILTKEGAVQSGDLSLSKISQVLKMVVMGVAIAMTVSFLILPISARKKLRANLVIVTDSLATMLAIMTESFLSGSEEELASAEFVEAETRHRQAYNQLDKLIREAKLEHFAVGAEREYRLEKKLVRWLQDITHNMGGLRSAASLQFSLIRETIARETGSSRGHQAGQTDFYATLERSWSYPEGSSLEPIDERPEEELFRGPDPNISKKDTDPEAKGKASLLPADVFTILISQLGPSMRSLAFTLKEIFNEIPFGPAPHYRVSVNSRLRTSLDRALDLYRESRQKTLKSLHQQTEAIKLKSCEAEADLEEVSASCGHFSSSLLEFGEQLHELLAILDELQLETEERPGGRTWNWMKFWQKKEPEMNGPDSLFIGLEGSRHRQQSRSPHLDGGFADVGAGSSVDSTVKARLGYRLWKSLKFFRRDDTKYAVKVGAGAALYALPSFLPSTRPLYRHWKGEWGLLSYMLVCSMTVGASNTTGYARFLGTSLGALCAIISWYIASGNVFGLAFLGWLMAVWTAYIIIVRGNGPMGRYIMLTYNLSVLYAYSLTQKDADNFQDEGGQNPSITEIAFHRVVAVLSGCIWGIIITRLIWPISARARLKDGLSLLWLRLGLIWKRDPLSAMANNGQSVVYMTVREKLELERYLLRLESLLAAAGSEFELKSAFADATYTNIIRRTRVMVNAFHAMNLELMKTEAATEGEVSLLRYTVVERQQLSARISHLLTVMASSMKLEYPLNDVLPSVDHARDRLLSRIYRYRQDHEASQLTADEDCALLYAYILVTRQLSNEISGIIAEIGQLFGVLSENTVQLA